MKRVLLLPVAVLILISSIGAQQTSSQRAATPGAAIAPGDSLPVDPAVRIGTLDNGVVYYIRRNTEPENRAELRLVVDAGSVLEDDAQRGLAHFVEHMLFNGTRRFPRHELIDFMERIGMQFGPEVNAYTSFDETVYMLTVPTDSLTVLARAFDVLEDWASNATLADVEIEKERGVVLEEWRARAQNAQWRIQEQTLPIYLHESKYLERIPIGDTAVVRHASADLVRRFYADWYRPDLMAVVAVGDFETETIERFIQDRFGRIESTANPRPRSTFEVPGHEETFYKVVTDPEYPYSTIQVTFKRPVEIQNTISDYREDLVWSLFSGMLNIRLDEITRKPNAPYVGAGVFRSGLVRSSEMVGISAQVQDDSVMTGLEAVLTEIERIRRHGFTPGELERRKIEALRSYERAYNERENTPSSAYAGEYVRNFLEDEPIPGIAFEYALAQQVIPGIDLNEVNALATTVFPERNRAVVVTMPEKEGVTPPSEAQLKEVLTGIPNDAIAAYEDQVSGSDLVEELPQSGTILSRTKDEALGTTTLKLSNGVRVIMKPTDFKEDEIRFTASSPGGSSLVSDEDAFEATLAPSVVSESGLGSFDRTTLDKMLAGKVAGVRAFVGEVEDGLEGSASPKDLETLMQLIYLHFTAPRADSSALASIQNQYRAYLTNRSASPQAAFQDSLNAALYGKHPRRQVPTLEMVNTFDFPRAAQIYRERFANAGDFVFTFVGAFQPDTLEALITAYLAALPSTGTTETWKDVYPEIPDAVIEKTVRKGLGQQSTVAIIFSGPFDYEVTNRHLLQSLAGVLDIRLRELLREELGGTYGASVSGSGTDIPEETYTFTVSFGTDPARVDEMVQAAFAEIDTLQAEGPTDDEVAKVKEQQRRERETQVRQNAFWVSVLDFYAMHPDENPADILKYNERVAALTPERIREAARLYLNDARYVKVVLLPEK